MEKRILVVEDEYSINDVLTLALIDEGYKVKSVYDGKSALEEIESFKPNLTLLDVMLPDMDGFEICKAISHRNLVIMITARDNIFDRIVGLELGADDYITKPFSLIIFISKVNAIMKRIDDSSSSKYLISKSIIFSYEDMKIIKNGEEIILSKIEYKLLKYLMENSKQILTKEQILEFIWDSEGQFVYDNAVAVNIRRLREKVEEDPANPKYIKNIRGVGYIWAEGCVKQ